MEEVRQEQTEFTYRSTPELKADLEQNTRKFVTELTNRLSKSLMLREEDKLEYILATFQKSKS